MIQLHGVTKHFGDLEVLNDISFDIHKGERLCVIGKSGTGKSVLIKLMTGLLKVDAGQILIEGEDATHFRPSEWNQWMHHFGVVFQGSALFDSLTIAENVGIRLIEERKVSPQQIKEQVRNSLRQVGLEPDEVMPKFPSELSGGMRKRVAVARAIIHKPAYVIYDEPTTGLDPINSQLIDDLIHELSMGVERTSIFITHDMFTVKNIATRVAMIHETRLHFLGTPKEFFTSGDKVVQQFLQRTKF